MTGIDISGVQPNDVPGSWDFIVVKSTEGNSVVNPKVSAQWAAAARTTRGLYHYARPGVSSGSIQASVFVTDALQRGFRPGVDIFQLDAEDGLNAGVSGPQWRAFIDSFMDIALAHLGPRGFLYAGEPFLASKGLLDLPYKYRWWLPDYGPNNSSANHGLSHLGAVAGLVVIHQYSSFGGLDQNVVVNPAVYGATTAPPIPKPIVPPKPQKVKPMYSPALKLTVAAAIVIGDTCYVAQPDGSLFCFGPKAVRGVNGKDFFVGREVARLELPVAAETANGKTLAIIDTQEERYAV